LPKYKEKKMANKKRFMVMSALVLAFGVILGSCASFSTRDGVMTPIGVLSSPKINGSRKVIAEYSVILSAFTEGYERFLEETKGKDIDIFIISYGSLYSKVQAVARE
jgi:hypothetical protein